MIKWQIGDHVIYRGKSYCFPGEVVMREAEGDRVVVKAFGDASGNYTGMCHIYADHVLEPYVFGDSPEGVPPMVVYPDENPAQALRNYVARYGEHVPHFGVILAGLDEWASVIAPDEEDTFTSVGEAAQRVVGCFHCRGTGKLYPSLNGPARTCSWCGGKG